VLPTFITTVVDGIALNLVRIQELGIRHIMVATVVPLACMPYNTFVNNFTKCVNNQTLSNETIQHNSLLEDRVKLLNKVLPEADIIIINQTKALETLFHNGQEYGQ
jgi:phospholipase/lecithinase/hemolysin